LYDDIRERIAFDVAFIDLAERFEFRGRAVSHADHLPCPRASNLVTQHVARECARHSAHEAPMSDEANNGGGERERAGRACGRIRKRLAIESGEPSPVVTVPR